MGLDMDLQSIQEVRDLIRNAKRAQEEFGTFDQNRIDGIVKAIAGACAANAERLAKMAVEETGCRRADGGYRRTDSINQPDIDGDV